MRTVGAAQDAARLAQRIRGATEKALAAARSRASLAGLPAGADPTVWARLHIVKDRPAGTVGNVVTSGNTIAATKGRTLCAFHTEGAGGGQGGEP